MTYQIQETKKNIKTLIYKSSEKTIRLHSAYAPQKESNRLVESFNAAKSRYIIVLGLGLAYHIDALKKKFPNHTILVLERDNKVVDITKKCFPEFIENISILSNTNDLASIFEEFDISSFKGFSIFTHRPSYSIDPEFYDNFIIDINKYISSKISDLLTRFEFEEKWVENILCNVPYIFSEIPVKSLYGKFKKYPGIIVSAGPSLRKNIKYLKELKDKAIIVCVDTALKVMLKAGITPHIVMVLDAQKHSFMHFQGIDKYFYQEIDKNAYQEIDKNAYQEIDKQKPILLADLVSFPKVLETYKGNKLISTTSKYYNDSSGQLQRETTPFIDWLEKYIDPVGDVQSGGSVATSLFDFLLNLGCSKIILVGQDLAYTGREIHSSGTYHNDNWLPTINRFLNLDTINQKIIRKRKIDHITAYGSNQTVVSDFVLNLYRHWFEDSAEKVDIPVINATEGGAFIANTEEITLKNLVKSLPTLNISPQDLINNTMNENKLQNKEKLISGITTALKELDQINNLITKDTNINYHKILSMIENPNICSIFTPFLKKTRTYIIRHKNLDDNQKNELLIKNIKRTTTHMSKIMKKCLNSLAN